MRLFLSLLNIDPFTASGSRWMPSELIASCLYLIIVVESVPIASSIGLSAVAGCQILRFVNVVVSTFLFGGYTLIATYQGPRVHRRF